MDRNTIHYGGKDRPAPLEEEEEEVEERKEEEGMRAA